MNICSLKIFFITVFLSSSLLTAQPAGIDSVISAGIRQIYNIKFEDAEKTFRGMIADYPEHPSGRFFLAMIDWWKIILDPDKESYDDIFFQKLEDVIYHCDEILDKNPGNVDALFFKGGAIGFRGRLRAFRESWLKAADDAREALPIVEEAAQLDPSNTDVLLGFGIYNYYASVIPEEYPVIKPLMIFFPEGDKEKGLEQLLNTAMNGKYANYEAQYFLMTLYYNYENNPGKAYEFASMLTSQFPDNPTFQRWKGRILVRRGNHFSAASEFQNILEKGEKNLPGYNTAKVKREAAYYVGYNYYNNNSLDSAKKYFLQCEKLSRKADGENESGFLVNSVLYLGMLNDLKGERKEAVKYYRELLEMNNYSNSHNLARLYLDSPYKDQ